MTKQQIQHEPDNVAADQVAVDGLVAENTEAAPPEFDKEQLKAMIARGVAEAMVPAMQAILPELLKTAVPSYASGPSAPVQVSMVENAQEKPNYLKHYRMDGVLSGKYQLIDVAKLDENGEIPYISQMGQDGRWRGDSPAVVKGKWVHFQNEHFYATTEQEVAFVEWKKKTDPQFRAYEDNSLGGSYACYVSNCGRTFPDQDTLSGHLEATHGVMRNA